MNEQRYLTTKQAADTLQISTRTLERWRVSGFGPKFSKWGSRVLYSAEELNAYAAAHTFSNTSQY